MHARLRMLWSRCWSGAARPTHLLGLAALSLAALSSTAGAAPVHAATAAAAAQSTTASAPASGGDTARLQTLFKAANQFWAQELKAGTDYLPAQLVFFDHTLRAVCDVPGTLTGPFYCPSDLKVYLDQEFMHQVGTRISGATYDYALGYVIGHELGLHIQNLVGTIYLVEQARSNSSPKLSARTWMTQELQTDCYAGLWMRWALMRGDVKAIADPASALDAVSAASQSLQTHLQAGVTMVDPLLTYGTAALRLKWYQRGLTSGRFNDCDTFSAQAAGTL